jgi:hypothetical protein
MNSIRFGSVSAGRFVRQGLFERIISVLLLDHKKTGSQHVRLWMLLNLDIRIVYIEDRPPDAIGKACWRRIAEFRGRFLAKPVVIYQRYDTAFLAAILFLRTGVSSAGARAAEHIHGEKTVVKPCHDPDPRRAQPFGKSCHQP